MIYAHIKNVFICARFFLFHFMLLSCPNLVLVEISFRFVFRSDLSRVRVRLLFLLIFFSVVVVVSVDEIHLDCQYFEWPLNEIPFGLMHSACLNCISQSHVKRRKFPSTVSLLIVSEIPSFACHEKLTLFLSE